MFQLGARAVMSDISVWLVFGFGGQIASHKYKSSNAILAPHLAPHLNSIIDSTYRWLRNSPSPNQSLGRWCGGCDTAYHEIWVQEQGTRGAVQK